MEWKTLVVEIVIHFCSPDPEIKAMEHMTTLNFQESDDWPGYGIRSFIL